MYELYMPCMKADRGITIGALCAILQVAFDDAAHIGELYTYLMMAACVGIDFEQPVVV
jgi:hypothetical protein